MNKLLVVVCVIVLVSCGNDYVPKPRGYFRIDLPKKEYRNSSGNHLEYTFEYPTYCYLQKAKRDNYEWINMVFPKNNATIHLSYSKLSNNLQEYTEDCRGLVYKHTIKADAIMEVPYINREKRVYGILYEIKGNAASNLQFYVTDSIRHFLRGALYFNNAPNKDSLAPVVDFIHDDIVHLVETLNWNQK